MTESGESDTGTGDSGRKRETYAVWAARYGATERTVKRWMAHGRERGEEPPLGNPAEMLAWWSRWMANRPPRGVTSAAGTAVPAENPAETAPPSGRGLEYELERLELLAAKLSVKAHEPGQAKPYLDTVARMVALTKQMREEAERQKRLLPRDLVETAIHEFHGPIEREIRLLYRSLCEILGLGASPDREDLWNRECDRLFTRFSQGVLA